MSEENVNVVKSFLDVGVREDWPRVAELMDPRHAAPSRGALLVVWTTKSPQSEG